jgi:hypothetical protein
LRMVCPRRFKQSSRSVGAGDKPNGFQNIWNFVNGQMGPSYDIQYSRRKIGLNRVCRQLGGIFPVSGRSVLGRGEPVRQWNQLRLSQRH